MRVVGITCSGAEIEWALVDGDGASGVQLVDRNQVTIPPDRRYQQLQWAYRETRDILQNHAVDLVAFREPQQARQGSLGVPRVEVYGVVQAAAAAEELDVVTFHSATITAALKPHGGENKLYDTWNAFQGVPKSRRVAVLVGVCAALGYGRRL